MSKAGRQISVEMSRVEARAVVKRALEGLAASVSRAGGTGGGYTTNRPALRALAKIAEALAE